MEYLDAMQKLEKLPLNKLQELSEDIEKSEIYSTEIKSYMNKILENALYKKGGHCANN